MALFLLHPRTCGFVKIAAYELSLQSQSSNEQIEYFRTEFNCVIKREIIARYFPKMVDQIKQIGKRKPLIKKDILKVFSIASWRSLAESEQSMHSVHNCDHCIQKYQTLISAFPVKAKKHMNRKVPDVSNAQTQESQLRAKTVEIYNKVNLELQASFPGIEFSHAQTSVPELKLQRKATKYDLQKEKDKLANAFKKSVEKQRKETVVVRSYGTEMSLAKRNTIRMLESFEPRDECVKRSMIDREMVATGQKHKKDHVGHNISWDRERCINIVNSYPDGYKINFAALARECNVKDKENIKVPGNAGQIVKEMLLDRNIDLSRFTFEKDSILFRRKKRKIEGTNISVPCDPTTTIVKKDLQTKIDEGVYSKSEKIVPQTFQKLSVVGCGSTKIENFEIAGRKIPIDDIKTNLYVNKRQYYRIFSEVVINNMDECEIMKELARINELIETDYHESIVSLRDRFNI